MTWQDPYGQYGQGSPGQNPYGQDPQGPNAYGQNPYGDPGRQSTRPGWQGGPYAQQGPYGQQGYGYYGPPGAPPRGSNGAAVGALVANIVIALLCCGGIAWLPGIILSVIAMNRTQTDPESAKQLTLWAWVCFALDIVLAITLVVVLYAVGTFSNNTGGSTPTF